MDIFIDQIDLKFTTLLFFEDYVISEINEGVSMGRKEVGKAYKILREVYGDKRFSYISHRNNDYNVNPADYLSCGFYDQVRGMAVICKSEQSKNTAKLEKAFF